MFHSVPRQTFIVTPNCVLEDRVQYSTVHILNVFCLKYSIFARFLYRNLQVHRDFLSPCIRKYYIHSQPQTTVQKPNTDIALSHVLPAETLETTDRTKLFPNKVLTVPWIWLIH